MADVVRLRSRSVRRREDHSGPDDALRRAGRGDEDAFAEVYDACASMVYGIALRVVRDPQMAEDIAQETFVEAWRVAARFDPEVASATTWLATIAHRKAVDRVRSEESHRAREQNEQRRVAADEPDTAERVEEALDRVRVREALAALTDSQREAVTLAYYGGRTYREVAHLLDLPEGTAKTRIRDGLIRLRDIMGGKS
ncbi:MAG: sigma-70 family RNA polymerase sigma factor [Actinomycetota bacterium]